MEDNSRKDIRVMLKTFGVKADEAIISHLAKNPKLTQLKLKVTLADLTDYGSNSPAENLSFEIESEVNR